MKINNMLVVLIALSTWFNVPTIRQQANLPADLIFTATEIASDSSKVAMLLVRLDSKTGNLVPFYRDGTASRDGLRPLAWSPDGTLLAIYRLDHIDPNDPTPNGYRGQLCILTRNGVLKTCLRDTPSDFYTSDGADQHSTVSWSIDSKRLYFAKRTSHSIQLVEADVTTGLTLRILYEQPNNEMGESVMLSWTPAVDYVADNIGHDQPAEGLPQSLINLQTHQQLDLRTITDRLESNEALVNTICLNFSPKGTYLTALRTISPEPNIELLVLDKQGNVVHVINSKMGFGKLGLGCPAWQGDESNLFFFGLSETDDKARVFRYSLADKRLTAVYRRKPLPTDATSNTGPREGTIVGPLAVSPDGQYIAGVEPDIPGRNYYPAYRVAIVYPDGHYEGFVGEYYNSSHPIWMPPFTP